MDEEQHLVEFFEVVESPKLWESIFEEIREQRKETEDFGWLSNGHFNSSPYSERVEYDLYRIFEYLSASELFERKLLSRFRHPPVTSGELAELASQHLSGASSKDEVEGSVARFIAHLRKMTRFSSDDTHISRDCRFWQGHSFHTSQMRTTLGIRLWLLDCIQARRKCILAGHNRRVG